MEIDYSDPSDRPKSKRITYDYDIIQALSYTLSSEEEVESSTILHADEINRRIAFMMDDVKNGRAAAFTKPITSELNYKQDASSLCTTFGKVTKSKEAAEKRAGYADLFNEFEEKYVALPSIKLKEKDENVTPNFGWMKPFPQALRDMLTSSIDSSEADQKHEIDEIPPTLPPKRENIQKMKRTGPPIPQLGRPYKKRKIDTPKADANFIITTPQKLLVQLVQRKIKKEKNSNDDLNEISEIKTEKVEIKLECFEDEDFDVKFHELSLQDFGGVC